MLICTVSFATIGKDPIMVALVFAQEQHRTAAAFT